MNRKISMDSKIPLHSAESSQRIPRQVSLAGGIAGVRIDWRRAERPYTLGTVRTSSGYRARRVIDYFSSWILGPVQVQRQASDDIGPRAGHEPIRQLGKSCVENVNWWSRPSLDDILRGPALKNGFPESTADRGRHIVGQS